MINFGKLVASAVGPLALGAGAAEATADEHVKLIAYLAGTVTAVVAVVSWVRHEVKSEITTHAQADAVRHETVLTEIRHIRELFELELNMREKVVTGEYPLRKQGG